MTGHPEAIRTRHPSAEDHVSEHNGESHSSFVSPDVWLPCRAEGLVFYSLLTLSC